jgi:DNA polymerase I-like protein with 3'-5' exonuclease and polymerase domains
MKTAFFDIETDGLLDTCSKMWVGVITDTTGPQIFYDPDLLVERLMTYDLVVGHNVVAYDIPALAKLCKTQDPWRMTKKTFDTCLVSRLLWPDRSQHPAGGSSLEAWGKYLGVAKGDHSDWSQLSAEMIAYCIQDVAITKMIYEKLRPLADACPLAVQLEHNTAEIIAKQYLNGFGFDDMSAQLLMTDLSTRRMQVTEELQQAFPPKQIQLKTKVKEVPFNPGSRDMIAAALIKKYGWKPKQFTETGKPQIDESILEDMPYPEAKLLNEYLTVDKRMSQLASWVEKARDGKVHGSVNTNGAVSGRMTHSEPNMAQVPRCGSPYGTQCRGLFKPTRPGWVQVGADASGLELRMFAHYLADYDNGDYAKVVCDGDVHTHNQKMAGLATRDQAKTFIYGLLYGAGDAKVGKIVGGTVQDGNRLKSQFKKQVPAYAKLLAQLEFIVAQRGYLKGLDKRPLPVRSAHSALNLLLQSAGAVVMKASLSILYGQLRDKHPGRFAFMANVHDEWQIECDPEIADDVGKMAVNAITEAGKFLNLKCPLKGEYKIGNNWAETH